MNTTPLNPADDGAQMSFDGRMSYGDYLHIDDILNAQQLRTDAHDEMLFINAADVDKGVAILADIMANDLWDRPEYKTRARVT